jgi:hypothetical protein
MWGSGRKQAIMVYLKKRLSKNKDSVEGISSNSNWLPPEQK